MADENLGELTTGDFEVVGKNGAMNWQKSRPWTKIVLLALLLLGTSLPAVGVPKAGAPCKKAQQVRVIGSVSLKCVKAGKKFVWKEVRSTPVVVPALEATPSPSPIASPSSTPSPTPEPVPAKPIRILPTSFEDLYEQRSEVPYAAWSKISETMASSPSRKANLELFVGPNTKPQFNDYQGAVDLLAKALPQRDLPPRTIAILFSFQDLDWAERTFREKLTTDEWNTFNRSERDGFIRDNCDVAKAVCNGARQQSVSSGLSVIAQGVGPINLSDPAALPRLTTGMLEVHEYFHGIQRVQNLNKPLGSDDWPPAWFREGPANWIQNAVVNHKNFDEYNLFARISCDSDCRGMSEARIVDYLTLAKGEATPPGATRWTQYSLGSAVAEVLVAVKGQDSLVAMYEVMATQIGFQAAFKKVYGIEWTKAIPIIAKTVHAIANNK